MKVVPHQVARKCEVPQLEHQNIIYGDAENQPIPHLSKQQGNAATVRVLFSISHHA